MALNCFNPVLLFILVSFLNFPTIEAKDLHHFCSENITTANSTYQANRKTLFASLSSKATLKTFYNNTVGGTVYGLFMCRGDVPSDLCGQCVLDATQTLSSECYLSRWAIIWYDECMVRYSNSSFFSIVETSPSVYLWSYAVVSNQASFISLLNDTMNKTTNEAAFSPNGDRYATKETKVSENQTLYCLAQCTRDLSPQRCSYCLADAIGEILGCCGDKHQGGRVMLPSCNVRYELYPFYQVNAPREGSLVPATKYSKPESYYLSRDCSIYKSLYSDFEEKLMILLSYLSSNATSGSGNNGFYKTDVDGRVFGLYMCRLDIPPGRCGQCVVNATHLIASQCSSSSDALVWYNHCLLRYSDQSLSNKMSTSPSFEQLNVTSVYNVERSFKFTRLSNALAEAAAGTQYNDERYQTKSLVLNGNQTIYILAQCTQDLSAYECFACLSDVIGSAIPWPRLGSVGGRVLYPSCTLRFELFKFYSDDIQVHAPPPTPAAGRKGQSRAAILIIVAIVVLVILFAFCCCFLCKKQRKSYILRENFGHESTMVEQLQFELAIIKKATNNFSHENKIGKGGFGEVYKGVLDGRHIAAKRLSKSSKQGVIEFKNEVLLIAKLQHRNLVAFIGFCLEDHEKILIYEYVPNKSLDYFLFDAHSEKLLSWSERHKIIGGVARGILYLHEDSRLKVIHRDLKPNNILLDENMNPKISDFGLARIIEINQQQGSTNRIVGTWGYMPPEYAMFGQFSEKSDVFSFGVMVLEIITGKKNIASYESHGLLSSVWRQYRNQTPLSILDSKLRGNFHEFEVTRCTHIGLLCVQDDPDDRPTMMVVVSYFSNYSIELPFPQEPTFSLRRKTNQEIVAHHPSSRSINRMSTTDIFPR